VGDPVGASEGNNELNELGSALFSDVGTPLANRLGELVKSFAVVSVGDTVNEPDKLGSTLGSNVGTPLAI